MYIDEKQLKFEMKEVHSQIHELANDLGGASRNCGDTTTRSTHSERDDKCRINSLALQILQTL